MRTSLNGWAASRLRPPVQQRKEGRCSVNEDQHFRGVCGGGGGGFVPQTQYSKLTNKS